MLLLGAALFTQAQTNSVYSTYIDRSVRAYEESAPAKLVREITAPYLTNRQKVTSIFYWITTNISYNTRAWNRSKRSSAFFEEPDDTGKTLKPLNQRVAETVMIRKVALCDGYARLFKTLCDHAGIPSEIIYGYARTGGGRRMKFASNHTWNAVYIDSAWYLLDATWASGFTNFSGDQFIQHYDNKYFLAPPSQFVYDHYPEDMAWTLLKDPPSQLEFNYTPFKYTGFVKTRIDNYFPSKGTLEASLGDSLRFEVETPHIYGLLSVSATVPVDTIWSDDEPVIIGGRKKSYTYVVNDNSAQWLYVTCNGRIILRYKLNIRKPDNKVASLSHD